MFGVSTWATAQDAREITLHEFTGGMDGYAPLGGLSFDKNGNLFGTTYFGGIVNGTTCVPGCGTVFELRMQQTGAWSFGTIHKFAGEPADLSHPSGRLSLDAAGDVISTANYGGLGYGGVFELAAKTWKEDILFEFRSNTGQTPAAGLTFYRGAWYGTTQFGSPKSGTSYGTVFSLEQEGARWKEATIHAFHFGVDGYEPQVELLMDRQGNIYGTTPFGGPSQTGDVYELRRQPGGGWKQTILYSFPSASPGVSFYPSNLIFDGAGNIYGTTTFGGQGCGNSGCGTVFKLERTSSGWKEVTVYEFAGGEDGEFPQAGLLSDGNGGFYGTTAYGGTGSCVLNGDSGCGTVFHLRRVNGGWQKTTIYNFVGAGDGEYPLGTLVMDSAGNLYGVASGGFVAGGSGYGTVFEIQP
jgi:hypothetical protein